MVNPVTNEFVMVVPIVIDTEMPPAATWAASRNTSEMVTNSLHTRCWSCGLQIAGSLLPISMRYREAGNDGDARRVPEPPMRKFPRNVGRTTGRLIRKAPPAKSSIAPPALVMPEAIFGRERVWLRSAATAASTALVASVAPVGSPPKLPGETRNANALLSSKKPISIALLAVTEAPARNLARFPAALARILAGECWCGLVYFNLVYFQFIYL